MLEAALALVRRQGFAATSIDQLCRAASVTKGAFFHYFESKEALGVAAAHRWTEITTPLFENAAHHRHADPLDRILGYLDFRAAIVQGPHEAFTCFAGTTVQETFAASEAIRSACGECITDHAARLAVDFEAALRKYRPREAITAEGLALYTQTGLQGGFVLAKAKGDASPLQDGIAHLKRYLRLLFKASYHFIDHGGLRVGGMMKQADAAAPGGWNFYFGVPSAAASKRAIDAAGGQVQMDLHQVPGGDWVVIATDPQGAHFGIVGPKGE